MTTPVSATRRAAPPVRAPREMSYLRILAQGLTPATSAPTPAEAVRRQLAVQGQQVSSASHAIVSRTARAGRADVDAAFEAGRLVRSWPMRGTIHITTAADHHWLRVALMHRMDAWARRTEKWLGLDDALLERAGGLALAAIAAEGPLRRARLLRVWRDGGLMGADSRSDSDSGAGAQCGRHLLVRLQREGVLVQGPRRGNEHLVVDATALPPAESGPGGAGGGARGTAGHRAAVAEIARRYATSHGPVRAADLARWTALPLGEAARALEDAVELTNAADYTVRAGRGDVPLVRAAADGGLRGAVRVLDSGALPASGAAERATTLYMRADLPDLLAASRRRAAGTHFLAAFDEVHVGYKDRACLTDAAGERLICPAANGMFRPLLVDRGRVVAVRPAGAGLLWADDARRSARLERDVERAVRDMKRRLA